MSEANEDVKKDLVKYEGELSEINKQLNELDNRRAQIVRVGVRIEGILAYLRNKEKEILEASKPAVATDKGGAESSAPAASAEAALT